jgi:hypothetical protein
LSNLEVATQLNSTGEEQYILLKKDKHTPVKDKSPSKLLGLFLCRKFTHNKFKLIFTFVVPKKKK